MTRLPLIARRMLSFASSRVLLLAASLCVLPVHAQDLPFDLNAGNIQYDINSGRITADQGVEVQSQQGHLTADMLTYDVSSSLITAIGHVVYVDSQSNTLKVDRLELTGEFQKGVADQLRLAMPNLGEVLQARHAQKVNAQLYTMQDVAYSPCKTCPGEKKPWMIKARQVEYDQATQDLTYRGAQFDVYGVPVMYLPYFSHPVGPAVPRNGLLLPQFGTGSTTGASIRLGGYVYNPAENADYTAHTRLMSKRGTQFELERRQTTATTQSTIGGSYLYDTEEEESRNHLKIVADKVFAPGRRVGINGEIASDDTYLNEFYGRTDAYLASTIYGEDADENTYTALSSTYFQDLDSDVDDDTTAQVFPHLEYEKLVPLQNDGSQLLMNVDSLNLYRNDGPRYQRLLTSLDYTKPVRLADGSRVTLGANLRGDGYNVQENTENGFAGRFLPRASVMWDKPYLSPGGTHTIAPTVVGLVSPRGGNPSEIPNEDSVAYELDVSNLFEPNRFTGFDRVETGPRLIYGLDNRWGTAEHTNWRLFLGQSLRKYNDESLSASGVDSSTFSDWVGYAEAAPTNWLTFSQSFRLDNNNLDPQRVDTAMRLGRLDGIRFQAVHSYLVDGPQELSASLRAPLSDRVELLGAVRQDLADDNLLLGEAGVILKQDCYNLQLVARRRGYKTAQLEPSTDFLVNVQLLTLGSNN